MLKFNHFPPGHPDDVEFTQTALMGIQGMDLDMQAGPPLTAEEIAHNEAQYQFLRELGSQVGGLVFANMAEPPVEDTARIDAAVAICVPLEGVWGHEPGLTDVFVHGLKYGATREYDATNGTALTDDIHWS